MAFVEVKKIVLDISNHQYILIKVKQGDINSRELIIKLTDKGRHYPIEDGVAVRLKYKKSDGTNVFNDCEILEDGTAKVIFTQQMTAVAGMCNAELMLIETSTKKILNTMPFVVNIIESVISNEEIESTDEFSALENALIKVDNANAKLDEAIQETTVLKEELADAINQNQIIANNIKDAVVTVSQKTEEANSSATNAENSNIESAISASNASTSASESASSADLSKSYAIGTGGVVRENDDSDCSLYYYEQSKRISQSLNGLTPMGTITFSELSNIENQMSSYMFNISDSFTTDETFKEGVGYLYGAGTNVYRTADGYWDCLVGSLVSGIKGDAEYTYRQGNVNITLSNFGVNATADELNHVSGVTSNIQEQLNTSAQLMNDLYSGIDTLSDDLDALYENKVDKEEGKGLSTNDLTDALKKEYDTVVSIVGDTDVPNIGDGTVTGVIDELNNMITFKPCTVTMAPNVANYDSTVQAWYRIINNCLEIYVVGVIVPKQDLNAGAKLMALSGLPRKISGNRRTFIWDDTSSASFAIYLNTEGEIIASQDIKSNYWLSLASHFIDIN